MTGHQPCRSSATGFTPYYVLEISRKEHVLSLRPVRPTRVVKYAALSYCWGREQLVTTTKRTIAGHLFRIDVQDLPRTLKDAVIVTDMLGLHYLWIDALCIIQDDNQFKGLEIAKMASIYSNSTVTIVASRAANAQEGFLYRRSQVRDNVLKVQYTDNTCFDRSPVYLFPPVRDYVSEPLEQRAWALQERLLAPRIIEFGAFQTRWFCQNGIIDGRATLTDGWRQDPLNIESTMVLQKAQQRIWPVQDRMNNNASNGWGQHLPNIGSVSVLQAWRRPWWRLSKNMNRRQNAGGNFQNFVQEWHDLVASYSRRSLSNARDRLPAISGIAERYGLISGDEYLAGFWKSVISTDIGWYPTNPFKELPTRPIDYQGPSWSWASVNASIKFLKYDLDESFQIEGCCADLVMKESIYGEVQSGTLRVKGHVAPSMWVVDRKSPWQKITGNGEWLSVSFTPDAFEKEFIAQDVVSVSVSLILVGRLPGSPDTALGLVLRPRHNDQFSRLGRFRSLDLEWDERKPTMNALTLAKVRTIEII
jgi:hypothetical protein